MKKIFIALLPMLMIVALFRTLNEKPLLDLETYIANFTIKDIDIQSFEKIIENANAIGVYIENIPRWEETNSLLENIWNVCKAIVTFTQGIYMCLAKIVLAIPFAIVEVIGNIIIMILTILGFY